MKSTELIELYDSLPYGIAPFNLNEDNPYYLNEALIQMLGKPKQKIEENFTGCFLSIDQPLKAPAKFIAYLSQDETIRKLSVETKIVTFDDRKVLRVGICADQSSANKLIAMTDDYGYATAILKNKGEQLEVLYANKPFYQLIGQNEKEFLLNPFENVRKLVSEDQLATVKDLIAESLNSGKPQDALTWIKQKDDNVIWLTQHLGAYKTVNGQQIILVVSQDVTQRHAETEKEEYKNECYRMIIDQTDTAVFEWNLKDGTFDSTPSYQKYAMSKVKPIDILNNRGPLDLVYPEDYPALSKFFAETSTKSKASTTIRIKMIDGTFRWSQLAGLFIKDVFGNKVRVIGTINDIDDDKQKAVMMDSMMEAIPGGIALFAISQQDPLLTLKYYSEGFYNLSGRTKAQLDTILAKNIPLERVIIPQERERFVNKLREKAAKGESINIITRYYDVKKNIRWVHMSASKIRDANGIPEYYAILTKPTNEAISYRSLVESSNLATFVAEKKTSRIIFVNDAWRNLAKVDLKKRVDGLTLKDLHLETFRLIRYEQIQNLPTTEFQFFHLETSDGYYLYVQARSIVWNNVEAYILYITDETVQKSIQAKNERNQALLDAATKIANISVWEMDVQTRKIYQTELTKKLHGYNLVIENTPEIFFQGDYISEATKMDLAKMYHEVFSGQSSQAIIQFRQPPTNEYHWEKLMCEPIFDENHKVIKVIGTSLPFDEVMERQQRYDEQMKVNWALARSSLATIYIDLSRNEILEAHSDVPEIAKLLKIGKANEIHQALSKLMASPQEQKEHLVQTSSKALLEAYHEGKTILKFNYRLSILPGWYEAIYNMILNPRTKSIEAVCILRDNTVERQTELIVNKLAETNYDGIFTIDTKTGVSKPYLYDLKAVDTKPGFNLENLTRKYCQNVDDIAKVIKQNKLSTVIKHLESKPIYITSFFIQINGKLMRKRTLYCYLLDDHSEILASVQDYTTSYRQQEKQQQKLEEALKEAKIASEAKSDFLSNMSHEIRAPMNAIIGMTKLAKDELSKDPSAVKDYLNQIDKSSNYLLGLLNDILDMSRIEKNKLELHRELVKGSELMESCIQMITPMMEQKNISFTYYKPDEAFNHYELYLDAMRVKQILMNVLNNAAKFTGENGKVSLRIKKVKQSAHRRSDQITISDNGCGMSKEFVKRIFQPFSQENNPYTNQIQGTGLGLALTNKIVTAMGGSIEIESTLNKGTKVTILLPYTFRVQEGLAAKPSPVIFDKMLSGKHILLCEDRPLNAVIAGKLLAKKGMIVTNATDGKEALDLFSQSKVGYYAAILMDIRMPRLNGLEATKAIRELKRKDAKEVPIIAMTANAFTSDQQESKKAGMNAHLSKPIQPELLFATLAKLIKR